MEPATRSWTVIRATWLTKKPHGRGWFAAAWSVLALIAGSVLYWQDVAKASQWMPASRDFVFSQGEYWRLWTTLFAHADLGHLISNSLLFFIFGYFLAGYFGLVVFPITAFVLGGLTNAFVLLSYNPQVNLIGVSGVVYWMGGMWLVLYLLLDQQRTVLQRSLRSVGVALAVFMPSTAFDPQVSYRAHLIGFFIGVVSAVIYYWIKRPVFKAAIVSEVIVEEETPPIAKDESDKEDNLIFHN
ncbi:rhomboid family intramembrane serine protease [Bdellovibrio sp. HCB-110]|uniref:rhomboid family intramembrane serine protease n=1 Tax=Bdellovibrio sp. HCB-110 TaxID=3391182 RepID=UPI0039B47907